jgi:tetratricopeptide (TPR) repeat protein
MTDWLGASAVLLAGLVAGFMFLYGMKRRQQRGDLERADLEAKRDAMIAKLRAEINPEERARLEGEAANVLRRLDSLSVAPAPSPARPAGEAVTARAAALKGFMWGAASIVVLAGIAWFVTQSAKPQGAPPPAATDTSLADLERQVQRNPDNLALRNDLAKAYLDRDNLNGVAEQARYVLQRSPNDARALTYQAIVFLAAHQPEAAAALLRRATEVDPNLLDAWVSIAFMHAQNGKLDQAEAAIVEAKRRHPEEAGRLDQLMARLRPSVPVRMTLKLANGVVLPGKGVIFIIARPAGVRSGPPTAVKRLPLSTFPIDVELSAADSMMGQPLPAKMRIEVRVDSDGDPMTRDPKDPLGVVDGVGAGEAVVVTLK